MANFHHKKSFILPKKPLENRNWFFLRVHNVLIPKYYRKFEKKTMHKNLESRKFFGIFDISGVKLMRFTPE